jgi:peptide/nickel transport system substrate-binding protein
MKTRSKFWLVLSSLIILSMVISACQATPPDPEQVIITVEVPGQEIVTTVEVPGQEVIVTVEVPGVVVTPEPVDRMGGWLDTIVFVAEPNADAAISRLEAADIDLYAFAIANPDTANTVFNSNALSYLRAFGNHDELSFNPNGPIFPATGKLNPFAVARIREAMNWAVDRTYIAEELYGGMAVPRWFPINNASNDYAMMADVAKALERQYGYDLDRADAVITEEMEELGATKVDGVWQYEGEPVEIIVLIRTEDTRRLIGDYVANQLEDLGFVAVRDYKTAGEAGPIWLSGEPGDGRFHIYTGGWISTAVPRDLGYAFAYFFTDTGRAENMWQQYVNDPEFYEIAVRLDTNDFRTLEERRDLFARALELVMQDSYRFWLVDRAPIYALRSEVNLASDLYGGPSGSTMWVNTLRREGQVGGSMTVALPSMLTAPWNPLDGSNWIFDMMLIRGLGESAIKPDLYTGLWWPNFIDRAEVFVEEGLPVGRTLDWVTLEFVDEITVPDDAWVDWDPVEQVFITAGEMDETITSLSRNVVYYPADIFETLKWHDGSDLSIGDFVMGMILTFDRGKEDSVIYDASKAPALRSFLGAFKGVRILSESPLVIETYTDNYQLDAENSINTWFPHYAQGSGSWPMMAVGIFAEEKELGAFSPTKATALEVDRFNYVAGPTLAIMKAELDEAMEAGAIPYEPTLSQYISADEIAERYQNFANWYTTRGHMWVGNGPYFLQRAFPVEQTVIFQRFFDYPYAANRWDRFAAPAIPVVEVDGPGRVTIGSPATFDVYVTFEDEDYAVDDVQEVKFLVFDATGELVHVGEATPVEDGLWELTLDANLTGGLATGSNLLEVVVVSKLVAMPVSDTVEFVTAQ